MRDYGPSASPLRRFIALSVRSYSTDGQRCQSMPARGQRASGVAETNLSRRIIHQSQTPACMPSEYAAMRHKRAALREIHVALYALVTSLQFHGSRHSLAVTLETTLSLGTHDDIAPTTAHAVARAGTLRDDQPRWPGGCSQSSTTFRSNDAISPGDIPCV